MFFVSRILLEHENILRIMAAQVAMRIDWGLTKFDNSKRNKIKLVGVPDGATNLGEEIAKILDFPTIQMAKVSGEIVLVTPINAGDSILLVEDFYSWDRLHRSRPGSAEVPTTRPCHSLRPSDAKPWRLGKRVCRWPRHGQNHFSRRPPGRELEPRRMPTLCHGLGSNQTQGNGGKLAVTDHLSTVDTIGDTLS